MIDISKVSKTYGDSPVLDGVDLAIAPGKFTAFIGPNGAGKSTLLSLISRLMPKEDGYLYIKGQEIDSWDSVDLAKELSMLKQKIDYQVKLTVEELISFGRYPYSKGRLSTEDYQKIDRAISYMDLEAFRHRRIDQLSGGQMQRVNIAMILAQDTDIILLDEPLNNLDIKQGILMMKTLRRLVDDLGKTVVVVIHDINIASQFVDAMVAFKDGKVFRQGTPDQVMTADVLGELYDMTLTIADIDGKKICLYR
ncbi:iron ABC transporter ATP-binding protein [Streptococcus sp. DD12]|uniref:iron ABC transporter ATP-binding protein n=1 Tax=Streptococcus sp. DD12 TaxID=1777880 RepID=UPI000793E748|nr:ATP-binding cassette domain-containing protein [Streptococcus sp. DD12]KXT75914.1 Iron compound ABC uptake transporter ATP-binding protein [Streptococcus sp. DD12]